MKNHKVPTSSPRYLPPALPSHPSCAHLDMTARAWGQHEKGNKDTCFCKAASNALACLLGPQAASVLAFRSCCVSMEESTLWSPAVSQLDSIRRRPKRSLSFWGLALSVMSSTEHPLLVEQTEKRSWKPMSLRISRGGDAQIPTTTQTLSNSKYVWRLTQHCQCSRSPLSFNKEG